MENKENYQTFKIKEQEEYQRVTNGLRWLLMGGEIKIDGLTWQLYETKDENGFQLCGTDDNGYIMGYSSFNFFMVCSILNKMSEETSATISANIALNLIRDDVKGKR